MAGEAMADQTLARRAISGLAQAVGPLVLLLLLAQISLRQSAGWEKFLGQELAGVPVVVLLVGAGPALAAIYLLALPPLSRYVREHALGLSILAVGLITLWSRNPAFDYSGIAALEEGGFSLWGRILASLLAVAIFLRLTRRIVTASTSMRGT